MKKIFSLAAAVLFAASINAQTITFGEGSKGTQTYGEGDLTLTVAGWDGSHSATSGRYFGTVEENAKVTGMIASGGKLDGTNRSLVINSTYSGTLELYVCSNGSSEREVTIGAQVKSTSKTSYTPEGSESARDVYGILSFDIKYGSTQVTTNGAIYIYKAVFTSNGEAAPAPRDTLAAYVGGAVTKGSIVVTGTALLDYSGKYNTNSTTATVVSFPNSYSTTKDNVTTYCYVTISAEGGFKAGDKLTIQPFTQMKQEDINNNKYANINLRTVVGETVGNAIDLTGSAAQALTVTNGYTEAGDPVSFDYEFTEACDAIILHRQGGTRINLLSLDITRAKSGETTAVENVEFNQSKAIKRIENGRLVIIRDGVRYDVLGHSL